VRYKGRSYTAHRFSAFVFLNFNLTSELVVAHRCDVPRCVNPDHLFIGTYKDNTQDMLSKGRGRWQKDT
jgi:hypothetical protein